MYISSSRLSMLPACLLLLAFGIETTFATLNFTNPSFSDLTAGAPFNVTWSGASGTTTLTLQNGTASSITTVGVIAFGIKNPFLLWSPYATVPSATYVLRLDDTSGASAYSPQFTMLASGTKTSLTTGLQFTNPSMDGITAGSPFNVTWENANGTTTLTLQNGTANSINTVDTIAFGISNNFLVWSPYATTPAGQYVLRLDDEGGASAYSGMFDMNVKNSGVAVVTTTVSSSPTSSSTSTSSSSSTQSSTSTSTTSSPNVSPSSSSLSTGAKAGIAIGAVLGALGLIGAIAFFLHKNRKSPQVPPSPNETTAFGTSHYDQDLTIVGKAEVEAKIMPVEISGGQERVVEIDGQRVENPQVYEMGSERRN
ncbi:hypothetical protein BDZ45DRAFT_177804 [Acephala macrosclerotiorum]|nr:hypothetical protein BDZ45DRAFT_177804 [Acephala macrosclerotiorum]